MFLDVPEAFTWIEHPADDHLFNLAIRARAKYLVTWENCILKLGTDTSDAVHQLRKLAPQLTILSPVSLATALKL